MKKAEREYLNACVELGCIACFIQNTPGTPAEIHHLRDGVGMSQRSSHFRAIPLCPHHHRGTAHPEVNSIHMSKTLFVEQFGTENTLHYITQNELKKRGYAA